VIGHNPSHFRGLDLPVEQVSWWDAMEFCQKLKTSENRTYRLPTEAEWEYACRAGSTTAFYFGDDDDSLRDYAWFCINSGGSSKPVARKEPNKWGLYDMHGNVFEWCADWHGYYLDEEAIDPMGPPAGPGRVFRGGSWNLTPNYCRAALRNYRAPAYKHRNVGFRVVLAVEENPAK
jgi:formylglycine-generating enzyme required for sulfatase activity